MIFRATQNVLQEMNSDCNLMTKNSRSNREKIVELPCLGPEDWVEPRSCL